MSDQNMEMQFASPDWQPVTSQPDHAPYGQSLSAAVQVKDIPNPGMPPGQSGSVDTGNRDKAGTYSDDRQGYQAVLPDEQPTSEPGQTPLWTAQSASSKAGRKQRVRQKQRSAPARRGGQLFALFARVALLVTWFTTPLVNRAFHGGWVLPLLGLLFLPLTALTYTVVFALAGGVTGLGWLWVVGALLVDLASYGGQASKRRNDPPQDAD